MNAMTTSIRSAECSSVSNWLPDARFARGVREQRRVEQRNQRFWQYFWTAIG